jgi:hypothetical protein
MAFNAGAAGSGFPATLGNISEMRGNIRKPSALIWRLPRAKAAVIALDNRRCAQPRSSCFRQPVSEKRPPSAISPNQSLTTMWMACQEI